jgi:protein-S-isoprenylcysteine O-methyltransferase Ste14
MAIRSSDTPALLAPPPVLYLLALLMGLVLQAWFPIPMLAPGLASVLGTVLGVLAGMLLLTGWRALRPAGTRVNPTRPTTALVTSGPFRISRNPLYLALTLLYLSIALLVNGWWPLLLVVPLLVVVQVGVIVPEER